MQVALDGSPLAMSSGGLRRYTEELAKALAALPQTNAETLTPRGPLWWSLQLPRELVRMKTSVFHGTNFEVPYIPVCPSVMTIHDLSPWLDERWHAEAGRVRQRTPWLLRLGLATLVITPSSAIRTAVINRFHLHPDRVIAIPEAAANHFRPSGSDPLRYLLFTGTVEPRKNVSMLVDVWREMRKTCQVDLVIAGRRRADGPQINPEPGLQVLGEVPESSLPDLYSRAMAVVYPSLYEGFGLPVLEAMQCGTPVITSNDPAIREVAGGAAIHADAGDPLAWRLAMESVASNSNLRDDLRAKSLRRAGEFSWQRTAQLTREVYVEAIRRRRR